MRVLSWDSKEAKPRSHKPSKQLNTKAQTYPPQVQLYTQRVWSILHGEWRRPTSRQWQSILPVELAKGNFLKVFKQSKTHRKKAPHSSFPIRASTLAGALIKILIMDELRADPPSSGFAVRKQLILMAVKRRGIYSDLP